MAPRWLAFPLLLACGTAAPKQPAKVTIGAPAETSSGGSLSPPAAHGDAAALEWLRRRPAWLFAGDQCPADVFPNVVRTVAYDLEACERDLSACLEHCQQGDANACFAAGLRCQTLEAEPEAEALFLRSCRLGLPLGCTHRAVGIQLDESDRRGGLECAARTFELTCGLDDALGCTMFGSSLMEGLGVNQDLAHAREMLSRACTLSPDTEACDRADELLDELDAAP